MPLTASLSPCLAFPGPRARAARPGSLVGRLVLLALLTASAVAAPLPRATPEAEGVRSERLLAFVDALDREIEGMHSVMVLRRGRVLAEGWWAPYGPAHNHVLFSLSKSFTSTAVGLAVAEGRFSIDDFVLPFFPGDAPASPSRDLARMRVRDLLTMTTGHQDEPPSGPDAISPRTFLATPVPHKPGTHFKYNTPATFMLAAIVETRTGQSLVDYLRPRLFEPLGIEHPVWDKSAGGVTLGGYGLRVRTEDIARFGQLYLQQGEWNGRRLLTPEWVALATSRQVSNGSDPNSDWDQGYGFQFWRSRHGSYRADGAFGQYCVVMPAQEAVVVITSGVRNLGQVLNVVWDRLLPAFEATPLPAGAGGVAALRSRLAGLAVPPAPGAARPASTAVPGGSFVFDSNDGGWESGRLDFDPSGNRLSLSLRRGGDTRTIDSGHRSWRLGEALVSAGIYAPPAVERVAATYGWENDTTIVIRACAYETPFHTTYRLRFEGDTLTLESENNVSFGPTARPTLTARRASTASR
jgi:CubicO group peptidase (beta-lactamase class C family)